MLAMVPVLALAAVGLAGSPEVGRVRIEDARVAEAPAGGSVAVSMLLRNPTSSTLVLSGAYTPAASQTVLQRYVKAPGGLVQVEPLAALPLQPGAEVVLAPGAIELQLIGLQQNLRGGLEIPLTLVFGDGTRRLLRIEVEE